MKKSFTKNEKEEEHHDVVVLPCSPQVPVIAVPLPNDSNGQRYSGYNLVNDTFNDDIMNDSTIPLAPTLITYHDNGPEAQNRATAQKTRLGEDIGRVNSLTERQQIASANYHSKVKPEIERMRIINATDIARQREAEGLEVKQDTMYYFHDQEQQRQEWLKRETGKKYEMEQSKNQEKEQNGPSGYQVKDYEVSDYNGYEYDTSYQYKSIYE
mmetsp:Transcript_15495/g.29237  ORF Transcript_15495/g.29237 Transcript_15495/m.29237 type:complete len:212 (-) Transcript_15495:1818-2453(-)